MTGTVRTRRTTLTRVARRVTAIAAAVLVALALVGCGAKTAATGGGGQATSGAAAGASGHTFPVTMTDDASRSVTVKAEPKRIVSLAPANTETLFALGVGDRVVGVTSYDDYPPQVTGIAKVGDFAGPNIEAVAAAKPDLILATSGVQADVVAKLESLGATVMVIDPQTLDGVYRDMDRVGSATGATDAAAKLVSDLKGRVDTIARTVASQPKPTVFIEIGQNPLFTAGKGTLMDELITLAGGTNIVTQPGYVAYSSEQLIKANPQVYLATKGSSSDPAAIEKRPGYGQIAAVKNRQVYILDDSLVSRPGPRIVEGLSAIANALHAHSGASITTAAPTL